MENNEQKLNIDTNENVNRGDSNSECTEEVYGRARRVRSRRKFLKATLITLIAFLLVITCTGTAILLPLLREYADSYSKVDIITRDSEQTLPPVPTGTWVEVTHDITETMPPETSYPETTEDPDNPGGTNVPVVVDGIYKVEKKNPDVENILVVGTDSRDMSSMRGRSDTMIVCSYNRRTGEAKLLSLMRDVLVPIEGYDVNKDGVDYDWNRLNATYSLGGIALCINTINQVFDLDIQRFVIINFEGTEKLVDACGGVDLTLTDVGETGATSEKVYIEAYGGTVTLLDEGGEGSSYYHLNGKAALIHMRHRYGSSDYKRTERQRNVLMALFRQVVSSRDLSEIYGLVREGFNMIKTNIPLDEMINLAASVVGNGANMSIGSQRMPHKATNVYFHIGNQQPVGAGQGGASVLKIDSAYEAQRIKEYIYGK